jgi:hypothetical protein
MKLAFVPRYSFAMMQDIDHVAFTILPTATSQPSIISINRFKLSKDYF